MAGPDPTAPFALVPTVLVRRSARGPQRILRIESRTVAGDAEAVLFGPDGPLGATRGPLRPGAFLEAEVPEPEAPIALRAFLSLDGAPAAPLDLHLAPARRWSVHLVQASHHDLGYTSLPSIVKAEQVRWLEETLEFCRESDGEPEDARFRAVIEQAWSLEAFFASARPAHRREMARRLREGRLECGATFGNMVTESLGHAEMLRCLEPAAALARRYGFVLTSAEHNDIPGFSWGLAAALSAARIRLLVLGLPLYHLWGGEGIEALWDERVLFGRGVPTVARYAAPDGGQVLLWSGNRGCGGDARTRIDALPDHLGGLEANGYPHDILRWAVQGAARDNSPYIPGYVAFVKDWNERYASPRLVVSTNARFLRDFEERLAHPLPTVRGDLPGQDYPSGLLSVARATTVNRSTQRRLPETESLAAVARLHGAADPPLGTVRQAWDDLLAYDEHAFGLHFPAGPAAAAAEAEKSLAALRSAALVHDASCRTFAALLDGLPPVPDGCWLAVRNPSPHRATRPVRTSLREIDNFLGDLHAVPPEQDPAGQGLLVGVPLGNRWHDFPPDAFLQGAFRLVDANGGNVPFSLTLAEELRMDEDAARRAGLGRSGGRIDFQPTATGLLVDLSFVATDLPACGVALYRLVPSTEARPVARYVPCREGAVENAFYRLSVREGRVRIRSLALGKELLEEDGPDLPFQFLVASGGDPPVRGAATGFRTLESPVVRALRIDGTAPGHPRTAVTLVLHEGLDRIDFRVEALKDDDPLLDVQLAVPLAADSPRLLCDGVLSAAEPGCDWIAPVRAGAVPVGEWVVLNDADHAVLLGSLSPMAGYDEPTPANVSFAHRSVYRRDAERPFKGPARSGRLYWHLFDNDFGTNFAVTQSGRFGFAGTLRAFRDPLSEAEADRAARSLQEAAATQFRRGREDAGPMDFPFGRDLVRLPDDLRLLRLEAMPDRDAYRVAVWNRSDRPRRARLEFPGTRVGRVLRTTATGEAIGAVRAEPEAVPLDLPPHGISFLAMTLVRRDAAPPDLSEGERR